MFESTIVRAKVYADETNIPYEIPVLLMESGPLMPLVQYFIHYWDSYSLSWMKKVARAVRLFMEFVALHKDYGDERQVFLLFRKRLVTGTMLSAAETGIDESGLYWSAKAPWHSNGIIVNLTDFFDWCEQEYLLKKNPAAYWRGGLHERNLAEAVYQYTRNRAFLGHTWSLTKESSKNPDTSKGKGRAGIKTPGSTRAKPKSFPEDKFADLMTKGFWVGKRYNLRDALVTLLMNGGGLRISEPFQLYLCDVMEDPGSPGSALVLIHHPEWGAAPADPKWVDRNGKMKKGNRTTYLAERYGLGPRTFQLSKQHAGWKSGAHENELSTLYYRVYWFVPQFGEMFWQLWLVYLKEVARIPLSKRNHPYAFMNIAREPKGEVAQLEKFKVAYKRAVERSGFLSRREYGTNPHGNRHAYGQRLRRAGISRLMIKRFMHHSDIDSQDVYTEPDDEECLAAIEAASEKLNSSGGQSRAKFAILPEDFVSRVTKSRST